MTNQATNTDLKKSVPPVKATATTSLSSWKLLSGHNLFMLACCAAMVIGTGFLIAAAPAGQTIGQTLLYAAPMLGCIGMHFVMHRFMGKSCHGHSKQEMKND